MDTKFNGRVLASAFGLLLVVIGGSVGHAQESVLEGYQMSCVLTSDSLPEPQDILAHVEGTSVLIVDFKSPSFEALARFSPKMPNNVIMNLSTAGEGKPNVFIIAPFAHTSNHTNGKSFTTPELLVGRRNSDGKESHVMMTCYVFQKDPAQ